MTARTPRAGRRARSTRGLDIFSAGCAAIALLLSVVPTSWDISPGTADSEMNRGPAGTPMPAAVRAPSASVPGTDSLVAVVVNGNVFSATRRAPNVRFVVPGQVTVPGSALADIPMPASGATTGDDSRDALPRLSAIVATNGERRALLQFLASDGAPRLYRVNDVHAGYRIVRIDSDRVILSSRAGTRTLRLSQRATPDSLENLP